MCNARFVRNRRSRERRRRQTSGVKLIEGVPRKMKAESVGEDDP
jgi:hypothetical protein